MIVGCYSMDLYCDAPHCKNGEFKLYPSKAQFNSQTEGGCKRQARADGWRFHRSGGVSCIYCTRRAKR